MLIEQTLHTLSQMRMHSFADALREQLNSDQYDALPFEERVGLLVDREFTDREARRLTRRLQQARFREQASVEAIEFDPPRGLDRATVQRIATCQWLKTHHNLIITGKTGVGKTFLACAFAHKACMNGYSAAYFRLPRLLTDLAVARADGSMCRLLTKLAKINVLILDDWGLSTLTDHERRDLLEVVEDRANRSSTIVASQIAVKEWHALIGEPTVADALLDRLVHNAHRIELEGESMRKTKAKSKRRLTEESPSTT